MRAGKGMAAGFIATVVLSAAMIVKAFSHELSNFNLIESIHALTGGPLFYGWLGHFAIGAVVWGLLFAVLYPVLPGACGVVKGLAFGAVAWAAMLLIFLPVAGAGFLGLAVGWSVVLYTLVLHLIYGAVLGTGYEKMAT